jgi:hypothetical protein
MGAMRRPEEIEIDAGRSLLIALKPRGILISSRLRLDRKAEYQQGQEKDQSHFPAPEVSTENAVAK